MDEVACLICGQPTRVPRNTPPIDHLCVKHQGQRTWAVALHLAYIDGPDLARAVAANAARATINTLESLAEDFEEIAQQHQRQMDQTRDRFDRSRGEELKGERQATLVCARRLRAVASELRVLAPLRDA